MSKTCLFVDDSPDVLLMGKQLLRSKGWQVFTAEGVEGATAQLNQHPVDAIVLDLLMPGVQDGIFIQQAKAKNPKLVIILFSGALEGTPETENVTKLNLPFVGSKDLNKLAEVLAKLVG